MAWPFTSSPSYEAQAIAGCAEALMRLAAAQECVAAALEERNRQTRRPHRPGILKLQVTGEKVQIGMADKLTFNVTVPAEVGANDVVKREAKVTLPDGTLTEVAIEGNGAAKLGPFVGSEGDVVAAEVVNIDNAGNRSEPRTASLTLLDTIAPAAPGEIGLEVIAETHEEPAPSE